MVQPVSVPEDRHPGESPLDFVRRIAWDKAAAIGSREHIVLGADTIVCPVGLGEQVLGKPVNDADAGRMLRLLSGRDHWVHTGFCLLFKGKRISEIASTKVNFITLSDREIEDYISTGEPRDKAGAYAIQGQASKFVSSIEGSYHNVVGLPVALIYQHLRSLATE